MNFIDIDNSIETFNSSSADLSLPDCSSIEFAALYWGGSLTKYNSRYKDRDKVKLMTPVSDQYIDLQADASMDGQYFKDITQIVRSLPSLNGRFTVANVVLEQGMTNLYGGWTIVIVYKNSGMPLRNLSVFDGMAYIKSNAKLDFTISGFLAPPTGPVDLDFGFVAYDGDRSGTGDFLAINNERIYDAAHDPNNTFNSSITNGGSVVKDRFPAFANTLGYDASVVHLQNATYKYLKNSDKSALISLKTEADEYNVGVLTAAIDIYNPNIQFTHRLKNLDNPGRAIKEEETVGLEYRLKNIGNDKSSGTVLLDTVPQLLNYVSNSLEIQYAEGIWVPLSDDSDGDIGAFNAKDRIISVKIGALAPDAIVRIRYKSRITEDKDVVRCAGGSIDRYGWLRYSGTVNVNLNRLLKSEAAGVIDDCSRAGVSAIDLEVSSLPKDQNTVVFCSGTPVSDLHLPKGYALYRANDLAFQHPLYKLEEAGVYNAYRKLSTGCEYSFNVIARADSVTIYSQPDNIEATVGSGVAFSVGVKGENVSFQWQVNKGSGAWEDISGATERSLTIPRVTEEMDGYNYRLRVTTPCRDYLLSVKVVLSVKKQPVSKPSEEPEPQPEVKDQNLGALFVPNAFMPASNTQELRSFVVKGHGLAKWQMTIFNKWDQVIWKTDVIGADGSPAESWDGKMFGADAPQGAYMWAIEAVFEDGKEWEGMSVRDSKPRKSGVVYLLR